MMRTKTIAVCEWCEEEFSITAFQALITYLTPKFCSDLCIKSVEKAEETAEELRQYFLKEVKGEYVGCLKTYPGYFREMIVWPKWSPKGSNENKDTG